MQPSLDDLISRLKSGESFETLLRSLLPEPEKQLLKHCATVRMFDEGMVDHLFRPLVEGGGKDAFPFSRIVEHRFIERATGFEGFYQLRESSRKEYFELWGIQTDKAIPKALRQFSQTLVSYYRSLGPGWELDLFYHLIAADAEEAEQLFLRLYNAADGVFDLGRCQDLLKVFGDRHRILSPRLFEVHNDCLSYLKARTMWSREFYQTVNYYEIEELKTGFRDLLKSPTKWMLQLYAPGGMGKTMFLRWLIARRCVPQPDKIPCARIDFDFIDPLLATQNPWMLILLIAEQLNEQIPGGLFSELLVDIKEYRKLLTKSEAPMRGLSQQQTKAQLRDSNGNTLDRFVKALETARLDSKPIIIFDTLEEVILYQGTKMMLLLEEMEKLRSKYSNICLILSGRYNLIEKLKGFSDRYADHTQTLELKGFSDEDARKYLTEKRGIDRLVDAIVERADHNPFKLSLYADIMRSNPRITEKQIRHYPSDLLYLIQRVLLRIPNRRVRWLLRYGVVPRKLRLSFVKDVMADYLPKAIAGESSLDNPEADLEDSLRQKSAFPVDKSAKLGINVDRLWRLLNQYASGYSWVSVEEDNTLSFHPEVYKPMRRILRRHKIFRRLHRAAIKHYEKKARADANNWGRWIQEAVYHNFQLDGPAAAGYWRRQIEAAASQVPECRQEIAREVINLASQAEDDYLSGAAAPAAAMVDNALLAEAYYELARAEVDAARLSAASPGDSLWIDAGKDFDASRRLQKGLQKAVIPPARMAFVESAILTNRGNQTGAREVLEAALKLRASSKDKIELKLEYAVSLSLQGKHREAATHYREALMLAPRAKLKAAKVLEIKRELAQNYENAGDLKNAAQIYSGALGSAERARNIRAALDLSSRLAETYLAMGQPAKARDLTLNPIWKRLNERLPKHLTRAEEIPPIEIPQFSLLQGKIALAMLDPLTALHQSAQVLERVDDIDAGPDRGQDRVLLKAAAWELSGLARAELMDYDKAIDELEQARSLYKDTTDSAGPNRCLLQMVAIHLRVAGNIKKANNILARLQGIEFLEQPAIEIEMEILYAEALDLRGKAREAQERLERLDSVSMDPRWSLRDRAAAVIARMINKAKGGTVSLREPIVALKRVHPPSSRLLLLGDLSKCPTPRRVSSNLAAAFSKLLPDPDWSKRDAPLHAMKKAEALRVIGKKLSPRSLLRKAEKMIAKGNNLFALRELYRVWDRLGWPNDPAIMTDIKIRISKFVGAFESYPNLCGGVLIEQADRLLKFGDPYTAQEMLDIAEDLLNQQAPTQWPAALNELRGRVLIERNLPRHRRGGRIDKSQEAGVKQGLSFLSQARAIYAGLENQTAVKRLNAVLAAERKRLNAATGKKAAQKKARSGKASRGDLTSKDEVRFAQAIHPRTRGFAITIRRAGNSGDIAIRTESQDGSIYNRRLTTKTPSLRQFLQVSPDGFIGNSFVKRVLDDLSGVSHDLGELLLARIGPGKLERLRRGGSPFIGLDIDDTPLAAIPWEFATYYISMWRNDPSEHLIYPNYIYRTYSDTHSLSRIVMWLQSALEKILSEKIFADGVYGPQTVKAVKAFQRKHGLTASGIADPGTMERLREVLRDKERHHTLKVLIVEPSSQRQIESMRGSASAGISLKSVYSGAGFNVTALENPPAEAFMEFVKATAAHVIHLCPVMRSSPSIGTYLDFGRLPGAAAKGAQSGSGWGLSSSPRSQPQDLSFFSVTGIGNLLEQAAYANQVRPLIILDVPRPPVLNEAVTQMLLRNAFASEIFRQGNTTAVLAAGLARKFEQGQQLDILANGLADRQALGKIVDSLSRPPSLAPEPSTDLNEILGYAGLALYTQDPAAWI